MAIPVALSKISSVGATEQPNGNGIGTPGVTGGAGGGSSGVVPLGADWVQNDQMFFLQDVSNGHPADYHYTRAVAMVQFGQYKSNNIIFGSTSNLLLDSQGVGVAAATLYWYAPVVQSIQVRVNAPDGPLFAVYGNVGSASTEEWVRDGTTFYLQDATSGDPMSPVNTLATTVLFFATTGRALRDPAGNQRAIALRDRESARFLNFLPGSTSFYTASPDGPKVLGIEARRVDVIDPATATITSTIDLSSSLDPTSGPYHNIPVGIWMKGPQGQDWFLVGPNVMGGGYDVIDPAAQTIAGTVYPSFPLAFNSADKRVYFFRGTTLGAIDANLQTFTVTTALSVSPTQIAALTIGGSGSLLLQQDTLKSPFPYRSWNNKTFLYDIQSGALTDIGAEVPNLKSGQASTLLIPSVDGKSLYTQGIFGVNGQCLNHPCTVYVGNEIVRYQIGASSPFLQERAALNPQSGDTRVAGLDNRYLYLWSSMNDLLTPSVINKVDPSTLATVTTPVLPAGSNAYGSAQPRLVVTSQYTLDLPTCGTWYCDAKP